MTFQFRFTFHHSRAGFFRFEEGTRVIDLGEGQDMRLVARDKEKLIDATRFHLEMEGFESQELAKMRGNQLRTCLHILNAALNLGLVIPSQDTTSASVSDEIKKKSLEEKNVTILDSIVGLATFPADGKHGEFVVAGDLHAYPSDPEYVLTALKALWVREFKFNDNQKDALEILGRATSEVSPRTRFLLCYLALERTIKVGDRSEAARKLLQTFIDEAEGELPEDDAKSLVGALRALNKHSVPSSLRSLAERISEPKEIGGQPIADFFAECTRVRNRIAHDASPEDAAKLTELANNLQRMVLALIWTESKLSPVSFNVPPSKIDVGEMQIRIL